VEKIATFFKAHIVGNRNDYMLIDATHLLSYSKNMEIAKPGYNSQIETHPETHAIEDFYSRQLRFGTLAIITNLTHASPEQIYINYKSRNNIEVMIDAMKNVLKADNSYMRNQAALEGWMFISFIALQWYYRI